MTRTLIAVACATLVACGGGGGRRKEEREEKRNEDRTMEARPSERRDDRRDERREDLTGWQKLGEKVVHGKKNDRDFIHVGGNEGTFKQIKLVVEHSKLVLDDIVVTFGDGNDWSPGTRAVFDKGQTSRVIDFPGDRRVIRRVAFKYDNLPGGGRAQIELWAK